MFTLCMKRLFYDVEALTYIVVKMVENKTNIMFSWGQKMVFDFLMLHEPCMELWQCFCNFCFKRIPNMSFFFQHLVELERGHIQSTRPKAYPVAQIVLEEFFSFFAESERANLSRDRVSNMFFADYLRSPC